jgi:hypothetical protein
MSRKERLRWSGKGGRRWPDDDGGRQRRLLFFERMKMGKERLVRCAIVRIFLERKEILGDSQEAVNRWWAHVVALFMKLGKS